MPMLIVKETDKDFGRYFPIPQKATSCVYHVKLRGPKALARRALKREHRAYRAEGGELSLKAWINERGDDE